MRIFYLVGALSFAAFTASGAIVDFATSGVLACGANPDCSVVAGNLLFTNNGATLTVSYAPNSETNLNVPLQPGFATTNFGSIAINCSICAGFSASFDLTGTSLAISVNQTNPFPQNPVTAPFAGTFSGALTVISGTSFGGNGSLLFANTVASATSGPLSINYYLQQPSASGPQPAGYGLSIGNVTTFQGALDSTERSEVPEPATVGMVALSLVGLALLRRKI